MGRKSPNRILRTMRSFRIPLKSNLLAKERELVMNQLNQLGKRNN